MKTRRMITLLVGAVALGVVLAVVAPMAWLAGTVVGLVIAVLALVHYRFSIRFWHLSWGATVAGGPGSGARWPTR